MTQDNAHSRLAQCYSELVQSLCDTSEAYLYEARLDDALRLLNSDILKNIENELTLKDRVRIQTQRAKMIIHKSLLGNDSYDTALNILSQARETAKSLDDKSMLANIVDLVGWALSYKIMFSSATYDASLQYFEQGLELRKEINDKRGIAASLFNVGLVYERRGRIEASKDDKQRAWEYYQQAYRLAQEKDCKLERSYIARHIAYFYEQEGKLDTALSYFEESLTLREEIGFKIFLAPAHHVIGGVYYAQQEWDKALESFETACALAEETGFKGYLVFSLMGMGDVHLAKNNKAAASSCFQRSLAVAKSIDLKPGIDEATRKIGNLAGEESK